MKDGGFDLDILRHAQNYAGIVSELPAEWELLKPVRPQVEAWKADIRAQAHERLESEAAGKAAPSKAGQVVAHKIFCIYVDRPVEKERITHQLRRTTVEREYARVTELVREVQLPASVEQLSREKVVRGEGAARENGKTQGKVLPVESAAQERILPGEGVARENGKVQPGSPRHPVVVDTRPPSHAPPSAAMEARGAAPPRGRENAGGPAPQGHSGREKRNSFSSRWKRMTSSRGGESTKNPFLGFVQQGQPSTQHMQIQEVEQSKPKRKAGLRWCFSAPFTTDGAIPQTHGVLPDVEVLSMPSTQDPTPSAGGASGNSGAGSNNTSGAAATTAPETSEIVSGGKSGHDGSKGEVGGGMNGHGGGEVEHGGGEGDRGGGRVVSPHEAAVRAALQEGAADASQREIFTQLEEEAVTTETIERFLEHRIYEREYVILVTYKGETLLPRHLEPLSCKRYVQPVTGIAEVP